MIELKSIIKKTPLVGTLARRLKLKFARAIAKQDFRFLRMDTDDCVNNNDRVFQQILNLLNYTKTSHSDYSAHHFPAAYHTININGQQVVGQRDPAKRLALVPIDFRGKTILDLGCNQGGMIHDIAGLVKWAVGVDFDARMINAANRIKNAIGANNTHFYVLDLQREPLELISDFLPDNKADICFLLSVCMWITNWQEVIDFAQSKSSAMLFETNGTAQQQQQQIDYLRTRYQDIQLLAETSNDDPGQKQRQLFYLSDAIAPNKSCHNNSMQS